VLTRLNAISRVGYSAPTMTSTTTRPVLAASRRWLRPVIHVLLRCGVTWREFSELARTTFVEVASRDFGKRKRLTNVSRTAVLTGLTRREVRKQREALDPDSEAAAAGGFVAKGSLLLSAWHLDPEFLDSQGRPLPLAVRAKGVGRGIDEGDDDTATFAALVKRCGGADVPATTLLRELRSAGAIHQRPDGRYEPLMRNYIPHAMDEQMIQLWGSVLADVATTYRHNLTRTSRTPTRFERAAVNDRMPRTAIPAFRKFLEQEGQAFLERADAWLIEHEEKDGSGPQTVRLGVGLYHVQD
jgi:hypothetical protein